jgi:hypothetical protein
MNIITIITITIMSYVLTIISNDRTLRLDRAEALQMELKLNLTKGHTPNYEIIGNTLYKFHCSHNVNTDIAVDAIEYNYLQMLNKVSYEDVVKNPDNYK